MVTMNELNAAARVLPELDAYIQEKISCNAGPTVNSREVFSQKKREALQTMIKQLAYYERQTRSGRAAEVTLPEEKPQGKKSKK